MYIVFVIHVEKIHFNAMSTPPEYCRYFYVSLSFPVKMVDVKKCIVAFEMHKMELRLISKADTVTVI